eukprot:scaffold1.g5191.t1
MKGAQPVLSRSEEHSPLLRRPTAAPPRVRCGMEALRAYPPELTSPPVPLVALAGWLRKHRNQRPAVAAVLVERQSVLDAVRSAAKGRSIRIVVVVVVPAATGSISELPEDRAGMICRQAGIDRRSVLTYAPSEGLPALQVIGRVLHEQAMQFYAADAQLGSLSEFRADWTGALRVYREAYAFLPQVMSSQSLPLQRFVEVKAVAEYIHIKILSLLLLALKQLPEACAQARRRPCTASLRLLLSACHFDTHMRTFRQAPPEPLPGMVGNHHGWLCRQHCVFAELLASSGADLSSLRPEHQPAQLYLAAASAAIERRKVAAFIGGMHGAAGPKPLAGVGPGPYVGQLAVGEPPSQRRLTEKEFCLHLDAEELAQPHSKAAMDLLLTARDAIKRSGPRGGRMLHHVTLLLGQEQLQGGQPAPAQCCPATAADPTASPAPNPQRLLSEVVPYLRRQGWQPQLASALLLLRECAHQLGQPAAHAAASLEAAALDSTLDGAQRQAIASAGLLALLAPPPAGAASGGEGEAEVSPRGPGLEYSVETPDSGWLSVLAASCGFMQASGPGTQQQQRQPPGLGAAAWAPAAPPVFGAGLWNNLPVDLPISAAELTLRDDHGTFTVPLRPQPPSGSSGTASRLAAASSSDAGPGGAATIRAPAGAWLRLCAEVPARCSGALQATALTLRLGPSSSLAVHLGGVGQPRKGAAAVGLLGASYEANVPPFGAASGFVPGRYSIELPPRHQPPLLRLEAPALGLQDEAIVAVVTVAAAAEAVPSARLALRALHRESHALLPMQPAAGQALAPAGSGAGTGAQQEGWALPELGPGQQRSVRFVLQASRRGHIDLRVALQYATAPAESAGGSAEAGKAVAGVVIPVATPLRMDLQVVGPPRTHALLAAAPGTPAPSAAASAQAEAPAAAGVDPGALAAGMQGLGAQDSLQGPPPTSAESSAASSLSASPSKAVAAAAAHAAPADSADVATLLARDLPRQLLLPAGQDCVAAVVLHGAASCPIRVVGVELVPSTAAPAAGAPAAPAVRVGGAAGAPTPEAPAVLGKGDVLTLLFSVSCASPAELPSLGQLHVRWGRHEAAAMQQRAVRGPAPAEEAASAAAGAESREACEAVETVVPLPPVSFRAALLTVAASWPEGGARAGQPVPLQLRLDSGSNAVGLDVGVTLGEPRGFLLAGPKSDSLYLLPRSSTTLAWEAVPYHPGLLPLPQLTVTATGVGQATEVTAGCQLFVQHSGGGEEAGSAEQPA